MTLMRWSLVCALAALCFLVLNLIGAVPILNVTLGFYISITGAVALGSLGAFVFRNY